jgi:hypothetical protein
MDGTSTSAMLVGARPMLASHSDRLTVTVRRDEIEAALTSDPPSELALDILRKVEGTDDPERRSVNVAWKREDLESVLGDADAEAITFSFDPAELERLLSEPDVEGHGLREAAVVLSIAAVAAVGGAASAAAATHDEATFTSRGIVGTVAATHEEATFTARGIDSGPVAATHEEATFAARGIDSGPVAATHEEATFAARGIDPGTVAATHEETSFTARGIEPSVPAEAATVSSGSSFDLPPLDPALAAGIVAALGAFGLAILGASFVSRRREPGAA